MNSILKKINKNIHYISTTKLSNIIGLLIAMLCIIIVIIIGVNKGYKDYTLSKSINASNIYEVFLKALYNKQNSNIIFNKLNNTNHQGYIFLAKMSQAGKYANENNNSEAIKIYDIIIANNKFDKNNRNIASIKAAYLLVDTINYYNMKNRLKNINVIENSFRFQARELNGLSAYKNKKFNEANKLFKSLVDNAQTPINIRNRALQLLELLSSKV